MQGSVQQGYLIVIVCDVLYSESPIHRMHDER